VNGLGWSRYWPMDAVGTLGRQVEEATMSRATGSGSEMEERRLEKNHAVM
jgi:hypothetical protein